MRDKFNLIYIFAGQLRYKSLGCNGDGLARTKNIDAFAKNGANMKNACSAHPLGSPYRASLFTGRYSVSTGMVMDNLRIKPDGNSFANILSENGIAADFIGKWHLYSNQKGNVDNIKNSFVPEGEYRLGFNAYFAAYDNHFKYFSPESYYHLNSPVKMLTEGYEPDHQTNLAIKKIKEHKEKDETFALFLSYAVPHGVWQKENVPKFYYDMFADTVFPRPKNFCEKGDPHGDYLSRLSPKDIPNIENEKRCYYAMTANLDDNFGKIISCVKALGIEDDTIIVFTSDHGEMFGAHGRKGKNIFYDEAVRVPFVISGPRIKKGENETPINTVDIMPTLLTLMGIENSVKAQGKDLSKEILNGAFTENPCLLMGMGPCDIWGAGREWRALRTEKYTYAVYAADAKEFLFDNVCDEFQTDNLSDIPEYDDIKNRLKITMYQKMAAANDNFLKNSYFKKTKVKNRIIL